MLCLEYNTGPFTAVSEEDIELIGGGMMSWYGVRIRMLGRRNLKPGVESEIL